MPRYQNVDITQITPLFKRTSIDQDKLSETVNSIRSKGVVEPILLRRNKDGYDLIAGYLRYLACQKAGLKTIPSMVYDNISNDDCVTIALIENIHRQELNDVDLANLLKPKVDANGVTETAKQIGVSKSWISLKLAVLEDIEPIKEAIIKGEITEAHARHLRKLPKEIQSNVLSKVRHETVRETEKIVKQEQKRLSKESETYLLEKELLEAQKRLEKIDEAKKEKETVTNQITKLEVKIKRFRAGNQDMNNLIKKLTVIETRYFPLKENIADIENQITDLTTQISKIDVD